MKDIEAARIGTAALLAALPPVDSVEPPAVPVRKPRAPTPPLAELPTVRHTAPDRLVSMRIELAELLLAAALGGSRVESPIEEMFLLAVIMHRLRHSTSGEWSVLPQQEIESFRVDFLFESRFGKVVVELDGHEFHERTKEQARKDKSRDRRLQALGYRVLRFTGSEVYADAHRCAAEVRAMLTDMSKGRVG